MELPGRPAIHYDALTIDVGITPAARAVPGAIQFATPVKPISTYVLHTFETLCFAGCRRCRCADPRD